MRDVINNSDTEDSGSTTAFITMGWMKISNIS